MKFKGRTTFRRKVAAVIKYRDTGPTGEEVIAEARVHFTPLPFDFTETIARRLPQPLPPERPLLKNGDTGAPVRDESGRPVLVEDKRNPRHLAAKTLHERRLGVASIVHAIDPADMSFDVLAPAEEAEAEVWGAYYDAVFAEMKAAGFPIDLFRALSNEIGIASGLTKESVREGMNDFLPTPRATPEPETQSGSSSTQPTDSE
jgi:hypothetical protein